MAKNVQKSPRFGVLENLSEPTHTHTHNDTHTHDEPVVDKVRKTRRIQILTYDSVVDRLDAYAKKHDLSRAEVFEIAISEFLDQKGV